MNGLGFLKPRLRSESALEYESRARGFESYSGHCHSRLVFSENAIKIRFISTLSEGKEFHDLKVMVMPKLIKS